MTALYENGPISEAVPKFTHSQDNTSPTVGNANPLRAINAEDLINVIGYTAPDAAKAPKAPISTAPKGRWEPCRCETEGRCASCDRLLWVVRQRLAVSDLQTTRTINSSQSSWDSFNGRLNRQWQ